MKFTVSDTGIGINPEDHDKLFTLFGQSEIQISNNTNAIGLGLRICQKIIEKLDGKIFIENFPGQIGATFTFVVNAAYSSHVEEDINSSLLSSEN